MTRRSTASASIGAALSADRTLGGLCDWVEAEARTRVTLVTQAINGEAREMEFAYVLPSGESFTFTVHAVYLPRPRIEISGPPGVQATFDWQAVRDTGTLYLTNAPRWHDLVPGVRVQLRPLTNVLMVDPAVEAVSEEGSDGERALAFAKALARRAVLAREGAGDTDCNPIDSSPEGLCCTNPATGSAGQLSRELGRKGRSRSICSSVSQKSPLMMPLSLKA